MSETAKPFEGTKKGRVTVDVKLQLSNEIVNNLNRAIVWWEVKHKRSPPDICVTHFYPNDFPNIEDFFGPMARQKLRGWWDARQNAVMLLANIQTMHPQILVSLLFHELGHCLRGHSSNPEKPPSLKEEKEAEKIAVEDYIAYFGKNAIVPQDPRLGDAFYRSLGLHKVQSRSSLTK